jgi:hypothetical protein
MSPRERPPPLPPAAFGAWLMVSPILLVVMMKAVNFLQTKRTQWVIKPDQRAGPAKGISLCHTNQKVSMNLSSHLTVCKIDLKVGACCREIRTRVGIARCKWHFHDSHSSQELSPTKVGSADWFWDPVAGDCMCEAHCSFERNPMPYGNEDGLARARAHNASAPNPAPRHYRFAIATPSPVRHRRPKQHSDGQGTAMK